jgi:hypothetical protein
MMAAAQRRRANVAEFMMVPLQKLDANEADFHQEELEPANWRLYNYFLRQSFYSQPPLHSEWSSRRLRGQKPALQVRFPPTGDPRSKGKRSGCPAGAEGEWGMRPVHGDELGGSGS